MFIRKLQDCTTIVAGDATILKEILHPDKTDLAIRYSLAHAVVPPRQTSLKHKLAAAEVYYILSGRGTMFIDEEKEAVTANDTVYIPPGAVQCIENTGDEPLVFLCMVDPPWRVADEEVLE
ncbi:MAG: cupin domain-containing protein [Bacteroidota bacterium]